MNYTKFLCILNEDVIYSKNEQTIFKYFVFNKLNLFKFNCFDDTIPKRFIIYKIYKEFIILLLIDMSIFLYLYKINETNFIVIN